jgi:hypothetical protein
MLAARSLTLLFCGTWLLWETHILILTTCFYKYIDKTIVLPVETCLSTLREEYEGWGFRSFELWCCVVGWVVLSILKECSTSFFMGQAVQEVWPLQMKALCFQMSGTTHQRTQCHIPEDKNFQQHPCENLISRSMEGIWEPDGMWSVWV